MVHCFPGLNYSIHGVGNGRCFLSYLFTPDINHQAIVDVTLGKVGRDESKIENLPWVGLDEPALL